MTYGQFPPLSFENSRNQQKKIGRATLKKHEEVGPQNPAQCGSGLPPECFHLKNGECIANQQCYSIKPGLQCTKTLHSLKCLRFVHNHTL